jgi:hypothetical protein
VEPFVESLQEGLLAAVADRVARRKCAQPEIEPDDGTPRAEILEVDVPEGAALEPMDLLVRCVGCVPDVPEAEPARSPSTSEVTRQALDCLAHAASAPVRRSFPSGHR